MDGVRISDGKMVMLKKAARARRESVHSLSDEVRIMKMFSSEPLASHLRNHCVPLYEVVRIASQPGWEVMVMPLLRPFYTPEFRTIGEAVDCLGQLFEVSMSSTGAGRRKSNFAAGTTIHASGSRSASVCVLLKRYDQLPKSI